MIELRLREKWNSLGPHPPFKNDIPPHIFWYISQMLFCQCHQSARSRPQSKQSMWPTVIINDHTILTHFWGSFQIITKFLQFLLVWFVFFEFLLTPGQQNFSELEHRLLLSGLLHTQLIRWHDTTHVSVRFTEIRFVNGLKKEKNVLFLLITY